MREALLTDTTETAFEARQAARADRILGQGQKTLVAVSKAARKMSGRSTHVPAARERANQFGALIADR